MPFGLLAWMDSRSHGAKIPIGRGNFGERDVQSIETFYRKLCKAAKPNDFPSGLWTRVGRRKHKFSRICHVAPMCSYGRAHWRHLENTNETSACGGDSVLCKITLTICYYFDIIKFKKTRPITLTLSIQLTYWYVN